MCHQAAENIHQCKYKASASSQWCNVGVVQEVDGPWSSPPAQSVLGKDTQPQIAAAGQMPVTPAEWWPVVIGGKNKQKKKSCEALWIKCWDITADEWKRGHASSQYSCWLNGSVQHGSRYRLKRQTQSVMLLDKQGQKETLESKQTLMFFCVNAASLDHEDGNPACSRQMDHL